jgi:hypothetical protein
MRIKVTCPIIYHRGRETTILPAGLEIEIDPDNGQDWMAHGWACEIPQAESVIYDEPPAPPVEVEKPKRKRRNK